MDAFGEEDSWLLLYNFGLLPIQQLSTHMQRFFINIYHIALGHAIRKEREGKTINCKAIKKSALDPEYLMCIFKIKLIMSKNYNHTKMRLGILYVEQLGEIKSVGEKYLSIIFSSKYYLLNSYKSVFNEQREKWNVMRGQT